MMLCLKAVDMLYVTHLPLWIKLTLLQQQKRLSSLHLITCGSCSPPSRTCLAPPHLSSAHSIPWDLLYHTQTKP